MCLLVLGACRETPVRAVSPANTSAGTTVDRDFARRYELDYARPMKERWFGDVFPHADYIESCRAGDRIACLQSTMRSRQAGGIIGDIILNCRAGDDLSCRYDAWSMADFKEPYPFSLSSTELRRGCAAGIAPECELLVRASNVDDVRFGAETSCLNVKRECIRAAESYLHDEPRSKIRARYYLEVQCQTFGGEGCAKLAVAYRTGVLEEPVPQRGAELERYVCEYDEKYCGTFTTK